METIAELQLEINAFTVRESIVGSPKLKLGSGDVSVESKTRVTVYVHCAPGRDKNTGLALEIHRLEKALPEVSLSYISQHDATYADVQVIVAGLASVERAVIQKSTDAQDPAQHVYKILAEGTVLLFIHFAAFVISGTNLLDVMGVPGVEAYDTVTNHVMETERVLGIEAARSRIISEIEGTMMAFGMFVDHRHTMLLADCMTYKVSTTAVFWGQVVPEHCSRVKFWASQGQV